MKRIISFIVLLVLSLTLVACGVQDVSDSATVGTTSQPVTESLIQTETTSNPDTDIYHVDGVSEKDMILYFNEVCLDGEFINAGDPSFVQKWAEPVTYSLQGEYTEEDYQVLTDFVSSLNDIYGFPGMYETEGEENSVLDIYFCEKEEMDNRMGESTNYGDLDGAITFWYNGENEIYDGIICYITEIPQYTRNSVIIEEIYNGLGPVQDTSLREDSIIYSGFSDPQSITEVDLVILQLLYHPDMKCGMNKDECAEVIRRLYY